ncbi:MAG: hypothetical protein CVU38_07445 [Chloroflexi bacterium HGW-Chloroflexi-1]|nr:MAG: hypothetical protein CVU38_07445 [Chloroflexi bacterium HGW-Chloroflexi-1]
MRTIELDTLDTRLQDRILAAMAEPVLVMARKRPILVIRSLLDDDVADELIAKHPAFLETIRRARQQKAAGRVRRLEEVRQQSEANQEMN